MGGAIPNEAVPASVLVLMYSSFCLTCSLLVVGLLVSYGERWTYVTMLCSFAALSTLASIIQQFHYAIAWEVIKQAQFENAVKSLTTPSLGLGGAAQAIDVVLFDIQFYCYNVMALNVLFWSVALFCGAWGFRSNWLGDWHNRVSPISKVVSVLWPILIICIGRLDAVIRVKSLSFVVSTITLLGGMSVGSILLVLILYKYMKTRRLLAGAARRGGWWASGGSKERSQNTDIGADGTIESGISSATQRSIYDRALVTRFTIGFVVLAIFEVMIVIFTVLQQRDNKAIGLSGAPNHSVSSAISDILFFIPGVTSSLMVFLVFGTTKSWRQYLDFVVGGCGARRRIYERKTRRPQEGNSGGLEFERLPSIPNQTSGDNDFKTERRVRMFVTPVQPEEDAPLPTSAPAAEPLDRTQPPSGPKNLDIYNPRFVDMSRSRLPSYIAEINTALTPIDQTRREGEDPVIQYEPVEESRWVERSSVQTTNSRRFVSERLPKDDAKDFLDDSSN